jgi:hypothetical protein
MTPKAPRERNFSSQPEQRERGHGNRVTAVIKKSLKDAGDKGEPYKRGFADLRAPHDKVRNRMWRISVLGLEVPPAINAGILR